MSTNKVMFRGKLFRTNTATRRWVGRHERERGGTNRGACAAWWQFRAASAPTTPRSPRRPKLLWPLSLLEKIISNLKLNFRLKRSLESDYVFCQYFPLPLCKSIILKLQRISSGSSQQTKPKSNRQSIFNAFKSKHFLVDFYYVQQKVSLLDNQLYYNGSK